MKLELRSFPVRAVAFGATSGLADVTAIFVTHDIQEAFVLSDRVAVMNRGRIEQIVPQYATARTCQYPV